MSRAAGDLGVAGRKGPAHNSHPTQTPGSELQPRCGSLESPRGIQHWLQGEGWWGGDQGSSILGMEALASLDFPWLSNAASLPQLALRTFPKSLKSPQTPNKQHWPRRALRLLLSGPKASTRGTNHRSLCSSYQEVPGQAQAVSDLDLHQNPS